MSNPEKNRRRNMSKDIIIDFESLSTQPDAALLTMGITVIDADRIDPMDLQRSFENIIADGVHWKFKVSDQVSKYGRSVSQDTLQWWSTQSDSASGILIPKDDDIPLCELPNLINAYLKSKGYTDGKCYTRGMIDSIWLQTLCNKIGIEVNIHWWNYRDVRTFVDCMSGSSNGYLPKAISFWPKGLIKHNALHDCALDAIMMYIAATIDVNDPVDHGPQGKAELPSRIEFDDDIPF